MYRFKNLLRKVIIKGTNNKSNPIGFRIIKDITESIISKGLIKKRVITKKSKITNPKIKKKKSALIEIKRIKRISRKIRELKKSIIFNQYSCIKK